MSSFPCKPTHLDRRQFLITLGTAAVTGQQLLRATDAISPGLAVASGTTAPWHQQVRRVGQVNFNERGERRTDFGLGDLFGITRENGDVIEPVAKYGSYGRIRRSHPILDGLEHTWVLPGAQYVVPVRATNGNDPFLTITPAYSGYPPEMSFSPPEANTDRPAVVVREQGASRLVYFAGDVARSAWRSGNSDIARLILNSIRWMLRGRAPVQVTGDGAIELFAWQTDPGYALHVLNYNNPHLHRGWTRDIYPIGPQQVRFELPDDRPISRVVLLHAEEEVPFKRDGRVISFTIPGVNDYEVAAIIVA